MLKSLLLRQLVVVALFGLGSRPAAAQELPSGPGAPAPIDPKIVKKQAARDAADGQKLLKAKSFAEAIPKLEASYVADPRPTTLRALAEAQAGAGDPVAAYRSYEK